MKTLLLSTNVVLLKWFGVLLVLGFIDSGRTFGQSANGKVVYTFKNKPVELTVTHGQYITGPDDFDPAKKVSRLLFTAGDISSKINAAKTMKSLDADFIGLQVDFAGAPRILYWLVLNNQLVQYSGTAQPETLTLTENSSERIAGTLKIDDSKAGGPKIDVQFSLKLGRAFEK